MLRIGSEDGWIVLGNLPSEELEQLTDLNGQET